MPHDKSETHVPPHNIEAEIATLGALMLDPGEAINIVLQYLRPQDFYRKIHQDIFQAIINLTERNEEVDQITVTQELRHLGVLEKLGGASYISSLTTAVPTIANVQHYARIVQELNLRRNLIRIAKDMSAAANDENNDTRLLIEDAEKMIFEIAEHSKIEAVLESREAVQQTMEIIEKLYRADNKDHYTGIPTGYSDLDKMLNGLQKSEFIIIGARPSVGKTALALNMATYMAVERSYRVGFFTLEMSYMALMQRLLSSEARIGSHKLRTGYLKYEEFVKLQDAAGKFYDAPLWIIDTPNIPLLDLRAQARRLVAQNNIDIIFIDYLTLIYSENNKAPRFEQIAEISRSLKSLARELSVPLVVLSQLTRDSEGRRPTLANIRESGAIEQDADVVIFLHRKREDEIVHGESAPHDSPTEVIVAKQRNGPVGTIQLAFLPKYAKFESFAGGSYE